MAKRCPATFFPFAVKTLTTLRRHSHGTCTQIHNMMNHPSPLAWSYLVLFAGIAIVFISIAYALRDRRNPPHENPRIAALDDQLARGEIDQEIYSRRKAEILIEEYQKHRAA